MRSIQELRSVIFGASDEQDIKDAIEEIVSLKDSDSFLLLIQILDTTDSMSVRNTVALGLRDLGDSSSVPSLIRHIKDPRNTISNGTLIYALETLDARDAISELAHVAGIGDYETIAMVMNTVDAFKGPLSVLQKEEALKIVSEYIQNGGIPEWKRDMLSELHELIDMRDAV